MLELLAPELCTSSILASFFPCFSLYLLMHMHIPALAFLSLVWVGFGFIGLGRHEINCTMGVVPPRQRLDSVTAFFFFFFLGAQWEWRYMARCIGIFTSYETARQAESSRAVQLRHGLAVAEIGPEMD